MDTNKKEYSENNKSPGGNEVGYGILRFIISSLILTVLFNFLMGTFMSSNKELIEYSQFLKLIENNCVDTVQIDKEEITIKIKEDVDLNQVRKILNKEAIEADRKVERLIEGQKVYYTGNLQNPNLIDYLLEHNVEHFYSPFYKKNPIMEFVISWILPITFFYVISSMITKKMTKKLSESGQGLGGYMNIGKSNAKVYDVDKKTGITFDDVAGQEEAKESLSEIVDFLHNPEKYTEIGAKQPKGALLVGSPGTGKTLLAKAVAGEANVPFFSLSGSEFVEMFVGVGASRVRDLFKQADKHAPCIIFIDEIDAIGKSRDSAHGGNDEREQTLNQLLAEMDGFDSTKGIIVLAATNRPEILDKALLRPGRFDRRIIVDKPDLPGREAILRVHTNKIKTGKDINLNQIGLMTSGATGADLANMVNEAALRAVRMGREEVLQEDLMESVETVIAGKEKKDRILSEKEKRMVAYHEIGHALATALQKNSQPVQKITIVPRTMGSLGYIMQMPEEEKYLMTQEELIAEIIVLLSGRTAEELIFGTKTTGASNDIERATQMARSMVTQYGMSDKFDMMGLETTQSKYLNSNQVMTCSEQTGKEIDEAVLDIIKGCHNESNRLLSENITALKNISEYLIEKETITGEKFMELLNDVNNEKSNK